jgi:hypothetical protein
LGAVCGGEKFRGFPAADKRLLEKLVNTPELWR